MSMGLKIRGMVIDEKREEELEAEARRRKEVSNSFLEIIYHRLFKEDDRRKGCESEDNEYLS